jgi:hypothetical protein
MEKPYTIENGQRVFNFIKTLKYIQYLGQKQYGPNFKIFSEDMLVLRKLIIYTIHEEDQCNKHNIDLNKGILLIGPVGSGKTYKHELFPPPKISESSSGCTLSNVSIEFDESNIIIYPNPSSGELFITLSEKSQSMGLYQFEIYSVDGELINSFTRQPSSNLIKVNIDSLQAGLYVLRIQSGDGIVYYHRLIKK